MCFLVRPTAQQLVGFQVLRAKMARCRLRADQVQTAEETKDRGWRGGRAGTLPMAQGSAPARGVAWGSPRTKESH